ncbi:MAG: GNAT family N-acetyltransferase [Rhodococcus sp. (in: high G+C Gram-positive bacteria)]|uniref:GNAT family N-acetyltransferase n=1 Tax=Rhodococcus sp. TaxID=1831 RepID=UPI003BB0C73B
MDSHHFDIVRLAWSRELGLPDDALSADPAGGNRVTRADESADSIQFLRLGSASALVGPGWAVERADPCTDEELREPAAWLALTQDRSGRCAGPVVLAYGTEYREASTQPLVAHDLEQVRSLESLCPPDDVAEANLGGRARWFTSLDDAHEPLSAAGYSEFQGFLADLGVLTAPAVRRRGFGAAIAGIATDDALDSGLIAQWRSPRDNRASRALSRHIGYRELGTHITVALSRTSL